MPAGTGAPAPPRTVTPPAGELMWRGAFPWGEGPPHDSPRHPPPWPDRGTPPESLLWRPGGGGGPSRPRAAPGRPKRRGGRRGAGGRLGRGGGWGRVGGGVG